MAKVVKLDNCVCPYCGIDVNQSNRSEEHVIGRRFVPKGLMENQWNLILWACKLCNNKKADLENDISAISMLPDLGHDESVTPTEILKDASRKALNAHSRHTSKKVSDSYERQEISHSFGSIAFKIGMVGPPIISNERLLALNCFHLSAFSFLLTYNESDKRGFWLSGEWDSINIAGKGDWGNVRMKAFMQLTSSWTPQLELVTADGYFKARIDRCPDDEIWCWAFEYNQNIRSVGTIGKTEALDQFQQKIPEFKWTNRASKSVEPNEIVRSRLEVPIAESEDTLFAFRPPI